MKFHLDFDMDNDAFVEDWHTEAAKILRKVTQDVSSGVTSNTVRDTNGNSVGRFFATSED